MKKYHLIFLTNSKVILSKKEYADWKDIQTAYNDYLTSLSFSSIENLIDYLSNDYNISPKNLKSQIDKITEQNGESIEIIL